MSYLEQRRKFIEDGRPLPDKKKRVYKFMDLTGMKIGSILVLNRSLRKDNNLIYWDCICDCGKTVTILGSNLKRKGGKNCSKCPLTHFTNSEKPLATIYRDILYRCYKKERNSYKNYGGRGIIVCNEWLNDFKKFYNWSISNGYEKGLSIDRINVNGNYEPSNCRWVTRKVQANNTRSNRLVTYNQETKTVSEWADFFGIPYYVLTDRINKLKWDFEKSITTPITKRGKLKNKNLCQ